MIIAEIGCGETPGPFIEGAATHYAIDIDPDTVAAAAKYDASFTSKVGDARDLDFDDDSIDLVLARNVFGDPQIGMSQAEKTMRRGFEKMALQDRDFTTLDMIHAGFDSKMENRKLSIVNEASRILVSGGNLVVVEDNTPFVAAKFMTKLICGDLELPETLTYNRIKTLEEVTSATYANTHHKAETWLFVKDSSTP